MRRTLSIDLETKGARWVSSAASVLSGGDHNVCTGILGPGGNWGSSSQIEDLGHVNKYLHMLSSNPDPYHIGNWTSPGWPDVMLHSRISGIPKRVLVRPACELRKLDIDWVSKC